MTLYDPTTDSEPAEYRSHRQFFVQNAERRTGRDLHTDAKLRRFLERRVQRFGAGVLEPFEKRLLARLS